MDDPEYELLLADRVDPSELDTTFKLIQKVENRRFIFDAKDPKHSRRDLLSLTWEEIATDIKVNGKEVTGEWCRSKWKGLRDYYFRVKKLTKGKSGQSGGKKKTWIYYSRLDRILSPYVEENEGTISNMDRVDSASVGDEIDSVTSDFSTTSQAPSPVESTQSTSGGRPKKRFRQSREDSQLDEVNSKILKVLQDPDEVHDEYYHFAMATASRLRKLPTEAANYAMKTFGDILYDLSRSHQEFNDQSRSLVIN